MHPPALLGRMVTIRLHLDDSGPGDGPLRVLPGSHLEGKLSAAAIAEWSSRAVAIAVDCTVTAGGAVIMRPLLVHASCIANVARPPPRDSSGICGRGSAGRSRVVPAR